MKKLFVFFLLLALGLQSFSQLPKDNKMPITTNSKSALAFYNEAITVSENVDFTNFPILLKKSIAEDPEFFIAKYTLALYNLLIGNKQGFNEFASLAITTKTKLSKAEELLKDALKKLIEKTNADVTDIGKELVKMYPDDINAYYQLIWFQMILKDNNGLLETLKKALVITKNPAPIYNQLGYTYMILMQNDNAEAAFNKYIELAPRNPNVYDSKGDYYMHTKEYGKAYETYMKAYAIDSLWGYQKAQKAKHLSDSLQVK
jgi:Putative Zn-dependent protease, contains TPR repeats